MGAFGSLLCEFWREAPKLHSADPGVLQSGIRARFVHRYPTGPACRITLPTDDVECQNYFAKNALDRSE